MILLLTGLPGSGKTHLARALAPALQATILNRDTIRDAIFPPQDLDYSSQQNQIATKTLLAVAEYVLSRNLDRTIILDGRPMSRTAQIDEVAALAERTGHALRIVLCTASDVVTRQRLEQDMRNSGALPLDDRFSKYLAQKDAFEPIRYSHLVVDTTQPTSQSVARIQQWLQAAVP